MPILSRIAKLPSEFVMEHELYKIWPLRSVADFLTTLTPRYTFVDGHKMYLTKRDYVSLILWLGAYESYESELVKKYVKPGMTALDIGANVGYYTLLMARLVGQRGKVYAFEPGPAAFDALKKNVDINGYKNASVLRKAVSDKDGSMRLYISRKHQGDNRIYDSDEGRKSVGIESVRLDTLFKKNPKVDFIKMDIEGAEARALLGMRNLIRKNPKLKIITEIWPHGLEKSGSGAKEYLDALERAGFTIFLIDDKEERTVPLDKNKFLKEFTPKSQKFANLLCVKN